MKILNKQKTHFLKTSKCGLHQIKYDTVENVNFLINNILDNGTKNNTKNMHSTTAFKEESR